MQLDLMSNLSFRKELECYKLVLDILYVTYYATSS